MKILITGANGFIGSAIGSFLADFHQVYGVSRSDKTDATIFSIDLMNSESVNKFIQEDNSALEFDVMLHLASKMASPDNVNDISVLDSNTLITKNSLLLAEYFKVKHFINFSSSSVYPNIDGKFDENSMIDPSPNSDCIYGLSKFNSEVLINYFLKNSLTKITHLRCGMVFSENMDPSRIYPMIKNELLETNQATLFGNGERIINYIFMEDLLNYIKLFIQHGIEGTYNVIKESKTLKQFAEIIIKKEKIINPTFNLVSKGNAYQFIIDDSKLNQKMNSLN